MWQFVALIRFVLLLAWVLSGVVLALVLLLMPARMFPVTQQFWYRGLLLLFGIRCRYLNDDIEMPKGALVVSNHISWADIFVIGVRWPMVFLSKAEVASWPVIGWLAKRADTLFIDRGKGAPNATTRISTRLAQGIRVGLFPEGKTTDGLEVLRFHPRIMQAAIDASVPVQPVAICYLDANLKQNLPSRASFAGTDGFIGSIWRTLCGPPITVKVRLFPPVTGDDRQQLAKDAHKVVQGFVHTMLKS